MRRYAWLLFLCLLAGNVALPTASGVIDEDDGIVIRQVEVKVFALVNQARAKKSIAKMDENAVILREARKHSHEMAKDDDVDHANFDERVDNIARDDAGIDPNRICELVTRVRGTTNTAPGRIYERFRQVSGGRECLFNGDFATQSVGIGVVFFDGRLYATYIAANDST
jgi:uncharacterized protein YkwD